MWEITQEVGHSHTLVTIVVLVPQRHHTLVTMVVLVPHLTLVTMVVLVQETILVTMVVLVPHLTLVTMVVLVPHLILVTTREVLRTPDRQVIQEQLSQTTQDLRDTQQLLERWAHQMEDTLIVTVATHGRFIMGTTVVRR